MTPEYMEVLVRFGILTFVGFAVGVGIELYRFLRAKRLASSGQWSFQSSLGNASRNWAFASLALLIVDIYLNSALVTSKVLGSERHEDLYIQAQQAVENGTEGSLYSKWASRQIQHVDEQLAAIVRKEMRFNSPTELTSAWRELIYETSNVIYATNVISPDYWNTKENMGIQAENAHRAARSQGVRIRRLYIVDKSNTKLVDGVRELAEQYASIGVTNRFIDRSRLEQLGDYAGCVSSLSTIDFVVYDESVVLLATHSSGYEVLGGALSGVLEERVKPAIACFNEWWDAGSDTL